MLITEMQEVTSYVGKRQVKKKEGDSVKRKRERDRERKKYIAKVKKEN